MLRLNRSLNPGLTPRTSSPRGSITAVAADDSVAFAASPDRMVQVLRVGAERNPILIVDDYAASPEEMIACAEQRVCFLDFPQSDGHFPGVRGAAPAAYAEAFITALGPVIADLFPALIGRPARADGSFSLTLTPPERLTPKQRIPHYDDAGENMVSAVHYLFTRPYGGTAFYRHCATGLESISRSEEARYLTATKEERSRTEALPASYLDAGNGLFEKIFQVEPVFNRMVVFSGSMLHYGTVNAAPGLVNSVAEGRLTANVFVTFGAGK